MTKLQTALYGIAFALLFFCAPGVVEEHTLLAFEMIAAAGVCVYIAERSEK